MVMKQEESETLQRFLVWFVFCCILEANTQQISTADCGKTVGCFTLPAQCTTDCQTVHKYVFNGTSNLVEVHMQSTRAWSSLAFNTDGKMAGLRGVVCINNNGKVQLRSQKATLQKTPDEPPSTSLNPVSGNVIIFTGVTNGVTFCKFTRTLTVSADSDAFMYDLTTANRYAVFAAGIVQSGIPQYHGYGRNHRAQSTTPVDVQAFKIVFQPPISHCDSSPCINNGSCHENSSNYTCLCQNGFIGKHCETSCTSDLCVTCIGGGSGSDKGTCNCTHGSYENSCKITGCNSLHATTFSCTGENTLCVQTHSSTEAAEKLRKKCEGKQNCTTDIACPDYRDVLEAEIICYSPKRPTIPVSVKVENVDGDGGVQITWKLPGSNSSCGNALLSCEIEINETNSQQQQPRISTKNSSAIAYDLTPNTVYSFRVRAKNQMGYSVYTATITHKTSVAAPSPYEKSLPPVQKITNHSFLVSLIEFNERYGAVQYYLVAVKPLPSSALPMTSSSEYASNNTHWWTMRKTYLVANVTDRVKFGTHVQITCLDMDVNNTSDCKTPVQANTYYTVFVRGYVNGDLYQTSGWYKVFKSLSSDNPDERSNESSSSASNKLIAGITIGITAFLVFFVFVFVWYSKKRQWKLKTSIEENPTYQLEEK